MTKVSGRTPFRNPFSGLMRVPLRFPLTLGCAAAWAAVTVARNHNITSMSWNDVGQLQVLLLGGLFLSLAATLFAEGRGWGKLLSLGLAVAAVALAGLATYLGKGSDPYQNPAFYLFVPGSILLMIIAPFLRRGVDDRAVWAFNLTSWLSVLFGLIVAVGLAIGTIALLGGLETLFALNVPGNLYEDAWIICMSLVWPWQTLAGIPGACDEPADEAPPRWAEYVVSWLLIPLALVYLALLYAFAAKVLVSWDLPRGTVGWLVGGFAAFGLAVWSAAWAFRDTGNRLARLYHRFFHFALIVPVILLAVGVGVRIAEYGVTEKRYALILLTAWLGGIALYGMLARHVRLAVAPAAFAAMLIAGSIGPWGAVSVSVRSQLGQLQGLLSHAGILVDGKIRPDDGLAGPKEVERISSIVRYLTSGGQRDELEGWLVRAGARARGNEDNEALLALMGLDYVEEWQEEGQFSYSVGEPETIDVSGFDIAHNLNFGDKTTSEIGGARGMPSYSVTVSGSAISVAQNGSPDRKVTFDLAGLAEALRPLDLTYGDPESAKAMTLDSAANGLHAQLHVESMSGRRNAFGGNEIDYGNGLLLVGTEG
jgi:hypothetical protein